MPTISRASEIFTPDQKTDLRECLARLHEERIEGANAALDLRIVLD